MKHRIRKKKNSKIIEKYTPHFENFIFPIIEIAEKSELTEFRTTEQKIKENIERQFEIINQDKLFETFVSVFSNIDLSILSKEIKKSVKVELIKHKSEDVRFGLLYDIVKKVEKSYPNIGALIFLRSNPLEELAKVFESYDLIEEFESLKGEKKARSAVRIFREVAEMLYINYLKAIAEFTCLLEKKKEIKVSGNLGTLAQQLSTRLEKFGLTSLVDADSGWLRNASCHSHWRYIAETDKLEMWDLKRPPRSITANELFEKAMGMYSMVVANYHSLVMLYLKEKICGEWLGLLKYVQRNLADLLTNNLKKKKHIEDKIEEMFGSVRSLTFK